MLKAEVTASALIWLLFLSIGTLLCFVPDPHQPPLLFFLGVAANPSSHPYIAYRTSAFAQDTFVDHDLAWDTALAAAAAAPRSKLHVSALPTTPRIFNVATSTTTSTIHAKSAFDRQIPEKIVDHNNNLNMCSHMYIPWTLGISKRLHGEWTSPIVAPPIVYSALPAAGPGRQIILTQYEHVDMLNPRTLFFSTSIKKTKTSTATSLNSPLTLNKSRWKGTAKNIASANGGSITKSDSIKELLLQAEEYPLLMEGSMFWTSPVLVDPDGEGRPSVIVADADGGIYTLGLVTTGVVGANAAAASTSNRRSRDSRRSRQRTFSSSQVPRLFVRREWVHRRIQDELGSNDVNNTHLFDANVSALTRDTTSNINSDTNSSKSQNKVFFDSIDDPYHSYFEWYNIEGVRPENSLVLQGKSANAFAQDSHEHLEYWARRRNVDQQRRNAMQTKWAQLRQQDQHQQTKLTAVVDDYGGDDLEYILAKERQGLDRGIVLPVDDFDYQGNVDKHREAEASINDPNAQNQRRRLQEIEEHGKPNHSEFHTEFLGQAKELTESHTKPEEEIGLYYDDLAVDGGQIMDVDVDQQRAADDIGHDFAYDDPEYGMRQYDDYYRKRGRRHVVDDEYDNHNELRREYYDSKHYIRLHPHILATPVLAEIPKLYSQTEESEDVLFVAVSYFLDEDEYEGLTGYKRFAESDLGDETEASRGMYVANAIMGFILGESKRWMGQTHLDLSTDYSAPENHTVVGVLPIHSDISKMGAFALGSPTVADIDGDGLLDVILGTSMGFIYAFDARQMYKKAHFPIQMPHPVESRVVVEDVLGDTNLEIFVSDIGGNVVCLNHEAKLVWHRNLAISLGLSEGDVKGSSPIALGDVNGDGVMDLVIAILFQERSLIFALNAATGEDLPFFPIEFDPSQNPTILSEDVHHKLIQPLLVDLHVDQSYIVDYIRRNGTRWAPTAGTSTTPGSASGLHIVYPQGQYLFIIEAGSGCSQVTPIGVPISTMVQVDDVHGTRQLDLIVSTEAGDVLTLESRSPYHPLNTWTHGEMRGRMNGNAHGYSASQGIYVHELSRQYIDVFGVYVPITFEIFDNRPNIQNEKDKRRYLVEIRDGLSSKRTLFRRKYDEQGIYSERVYIRFGPGFYTLHVVMQTSHGLVYEDMFHLGYNVRFMSGFGVLLWLPLLVGSLTIVLCNSRKSEWEEEDTDMDRNGHIFGIRGQQLPS